MEFIDGFVAAVPTAKKEEYIRHAREAARLFRKHGALRLVECWGEDVPDGEITSFPMAVKCQPDETVIFSWAVWPSREVRDTGMKALFEDPEMQEMEMPFDASRIIFGGFQMVVNE